MSRRVMHRLALDAATVEVVDEFRRRGIEPILLKGRSIADRLYGGDAAARPYTDIDLLVAPDRHADAADALAALTFTDRLAGFRPGERPAHADSWARADRVHVDLHRTLNCATAAPEVVWAALSRHTRPLRLGAITVQALDDVGLALHIAMHAAQHGACSAKPQTDLARALAVFGPEVFGAAAPLAAEIGALATLATGLRLVPQGREPAERIGTGVAVPDALLVRAHGTARGAGSVAAGLAEPARRRPRVVAQRAFPSRAALRLSMPLARHGRWGLAAAYAVRPLWIAARLPSAVRAWRAATGRPSA